MAVITFVKALLFSCTKRKGYCAAVVFIIEIPVGVGFETTGRPVLCAARVGEGKELQ